MVIVHTDKIFCGFYKKCFLGKYCPNALTSVVKKELAISRDIIAIYAGEPGCFKKK